MKLNGKLNSGKTVCHPKKTPPEVGMKTKGLPKNSEARKARPTTATSLTRICRQLTLLPAPKTALTLKKLKTNCQNYHKPSAKDLLKNLKCQLKTRKPSLPTKAWLTFLNKQFPSF